MASRRSRANSVQPSTDSYSSKWGRVVVFNGENYPTFSLTCKAALVASQSWSIVNGTERDPRGDAEADFNTRRNLAIQIIFSSVSQDYVHTIAPFLDISDPKGMWDKLKTLDRGRDSVFVANIRAQFAKEIFDPTTQTVRQFKRILDHYRNQIASTTNPITDEEAKKQAITVSS
jgi:hypothetical protein